MKNAKIVALSVLVIASGLAFETLITRSGPPVQYPVLTESGQALRTLFDGVPRLATIKHIAFVTSDVRAYTSDGAFSRYIAWIGANTAIQRLVRTSPFSAKSLLQATVPFGPRGMLRHPRAGRTPPMMS